MKTLNSQSILTTKLIRYLGDLLSKISLRLSKHFPLFKNLGPNISKPWQFFYERQKNVIFRQSIYRVIFGAISSGLEKKCFSYILTGLTQVIFSDGYGRATKRADLHVDLFPTLTNF